MLEDETCWFLAADFDKGSWMQDVEAFPATCREFAVSAAVERSRSGNGAHVWIFFAERHPELVPELEGIIREVGAGVAFEDIANKVVTAIAALTMFDLARNHAASSLPQSSTGRFDVMIVLVRS